jgi:hypothetical protein
MQTIDEFIEQTRTLSSQDRKRLLEHLQNLITEEAPTQPSTKKKGPYTHSLALAGTIHTLHPDVSADKYKHLAEAYADRHEEQ